MGRSLGLFADSPTFESGALKSLPLRACLAEFPVGPSCKDIDFTSSGPLFGLGTAAKKGLEPDTRACHQILPAGARNERVSAMGVPGFVQQSESPFCGDLDLALSGLLECDRNTPTDGFKPTAQPLDWPFHDAPPFFPSPATTGIFPHAKITPLSLSAYITRSVPEGGLTVPGCRYIRHY